MFNLPENLNIYNVKEVQEQLLEHMQQLTEEEAKETILDFSVLRDIDAAGLQLLMAANKSFASAGLIMKVTGISSFVQHLLDLSGSSEILEQRG